MNVWSLKTTNLRMRTTGQMLSWLLSGRRYVGMVLFSTHLPFFFRSLLLVKPSKTISPPYGCVVLEPKRQIYFCLVDKYMRKLAMLTLASQQNRLLSLRSNKPTNINVIASGFSCLKICFDRNV